MSVIVRTSKFRHVYAESSKPEQSFTNLRLSNVAGEQSYIKANGLFFATGLQGGGGPFAVIPLSQPKRYEDLFAVTGHTAPVLDFDFHPFDDYVLASASEDLTVKIWRIPENGLTANLNTPVVDLRGHDKKVLLLRFHPTASNVLASTSADQTVKIWDIEQGTQIYNLPSEVHEQPIQDIVWDYTGKTYATSSKDKHVRIIDPRSSIVSTTISNAHEGSKSTKLTYAGTLDRLVTVGFTKFSARQFKIWDPRNTSQELKKIDLDQSAGVILPFFDPDTNLLYLAGKGDGNVRYYELVSDNPYVHPLSEYKSNVAARGMAWIPKRSLNVMGCETARLLKLTTNSVEPLSFFVPRRSENFQEDLYPPTASSVPAHTAQQWSNGSNQPPKLMSIRPGVAVATSNNVDSLKSVESGITGWLSGTGTVKNKENTPSTSSSSSSSSSSTAATTVPATSSDANVLDWLVGSSSSQPVVVANTSTSTSTKGKSSPQIPAPVAAALRGTTLPKPPTTNSTTLPTKQKADIKTPPPVYMKPSQTMAAAKKGGAAEATENGSRVGTSHNSSHTKRNIPVSEASSPYDKTPATPDEGTNINNMVCGVEKITCLQS